MENLESRLASLCVTSPADDVISALVAAISASPEDIASLADDSVSQLSRLLTSPHVKAAELSSQAAPLARLIAELGKRELARTQLASPALISQLVSYLVREQSSDEVLVEACRALGNLCYENEEARAVLMEVEEGTQAVGGALERALRSGESGGRAREVTTGMLLNFVNDHPPAIDWAVDSDTMTRLLASACADVTGGPGDVTGAAVEPAYLRHVLVTAGVVCESERREVLLNSRLASLLAACLHPEQDAGVLEEALDTASSWCHHDNAKLSMAQAGVCEALCSLIASKEPPAEARAVLIEILSGDEAMTALYRRGEGPLYQTVRSWLVDKEGPEELVACACHALGNFATNDDHALAMVRSGVHRDLVGPLTSDSPRLQMAALGLLRNLSVPAQNKVTIIEAGLLDTMMALSVVEQPAFFKYYGTLRLLVESNAEACCHLAAKSALLTQLATAARSDGPYGVQHEAGRLMARIVSTAKSASVSGNVVTSGGHDCLVRLLQTTNAVMANEAILALCLTAQATEPQQIVSSELANALSDVMGNAEFPIQVKENAATLLQVLRSREDDALRSTCQKYRSLT